MKDNIREKILLGGLFHDIGKFYQRASDKSISEVCPNSKSLNCEYSHSVWTYAFFYLPDVRNVLESFSELGIYDENEGDVNVVNMSTNHHLPNNVYEAYVTMGDWWSAGRDRQSSVDKSKDDKNSPLYSIYNVVNKGQADINMGFNLKPLKLDKGSIFPHKVAKDDGGISDNDYKELFESFIEEFKKLPTDNITAFTETLLFLLKKYTWCIPSNTDDMANVSLYEHLKMTAAFADCMYVYHCENKDAFSYDAKSKGFELAEGNYPVMLLGGDVSGIQKFIYNISSTKAAKSLKGRSFYLQLLIDSILQRVIRHEGIKASYAHVVYSSGGKFYMLLPNTEGVKYAINEIKKSLESELWELHKGKLSVNIDYVEFAYTDTRDNNNILIKDNTDIGCLGDLWKALALKITKCKSRRFRTLLEDKYDSIFGVSQSGGDVRVCAVTGEELTNENSVPLDKSDKDKCISKAVQEQIGLGTVLKDADYVITHTDADRDCHLGKIVSKEANVKIADVYNYLFDRKELIKEEAAFRDISLSDVSKVTCFNDTNFIVPLKGKRVSYGFQFYGGNKQASISQDKAKDFSDLADNSYLGILRMDVDSLGNVFIKGLPDDQKSFAAYATMSFLLDLFFSGYLNNIREKYKNDVNILYSGGDDVFAIGRWDKTIEFAEEIRSEFKEFIGRSDISISGGLAIVRNKFPIAKAAEIAADGEEASKKYVSGKYGDKNAITFLGETISWNEEFPLVKELSQKLKAMCESGEIAKGFLHRMMAYDFIIKENERKLKENPQFKRDLSYKSHTVYYFRRVMDRNKNSNNLKEFLEEQQPKLFQSDRYYSLFSLACRWTELLLK